jgi:hypothetical protein
VVTISDLLWLNINSWKTKENVFISCLSVTAAEVGREGICGAGRRCDAFPIQCLTIIAC